MKLPKTLGDTGRERIINKPHGYLIRVEPGELDMSRFEGLVTAAQAAARDGSWDQAVTCARGALELWRREVRAHVDSAVLAAREAPRPGGSRGQLLVETLLSLTERASSD